MVYANPKSSMANMVMATMVTTKSEKTGFIKPVSGGFFIFASRDHRSAIAANTRRTL
jgi:hypothetical protein